MGLLGSLKKSLSRCLDRKNRHADDRDVPLLDQADIQEARLTINTNSEAETISTASPSSTHTITTALINPSEQPWYYPTTKEAILLTMDAVCDAPWVIMTTKALNYRFEKTDDFWEQTFAQQLWSAIPVLTLATPTAYFWAKHHSKNFRDCLIYAGIASVSTLATVIPWNMLDAAGKLFFLGRGYSDIAANYLSGIFPGPGIADVIQTLAINGLSYQFDSTYQFNGAEFAIGFSPLNYLGGNAWKILLIALDEIAKASTAGLIGQVAGVVLPVLLINFLTMKATTALAKQCRKSRQNLDVDADTINTIRKTSSPVHTIETRVTENSSPYAAKRNTG